MLTISSLPASHIATPARQAQDPQRGTLAFEDRLANGPVRIIDAKEHLFSQGDARTHVYKIESGAICLYKVMADGRRQVLNIALPGDLIGLGSASEHAFNAQATRRARLRSMPAAAIHKLASEDGCFGLKLYEAISLELAASRELLLTVGQPSALERVASFLLALSKRSVRNGESAESIKLPMTRADIGDFLGLTIETVSRTFTKLKLQGLIELDQSSGARLLDVGALEELADGEAN
jgi:CRP-like cAMP-binding protein